jgi:hypothetical protein
MFVVADIGTWILPQWSVLPVTLFSSLYVHISLPSVIFTSADVLWMLKTTKIQWETFALCASFSFVYPFHFFISLLSLLKPWIKLHFYHSYNKIWQSCYLCNEVSTTAAREWKKFTPIVKIFPVFLLHFFSLITFLAPKNLQSSLPPPRI